MTWSKEIYTRVGLLREVSDETDSGSGGAGPESLRPRSQHMDPMRPQPRGADLTDGNSSRGLEFSSQSNVNTSPTLRQDARDGVTKRADIDTIPYGDKLTAWTVQNVGTGRAEIDGAQAAADTAASIRNSSFGRFRDENGEASDRRNTALRDAYLTGRAGESQGVAPNRNYADFGRDQRNDILRDRMLGRD